MGNFAIYEERPTKEMFLRILQNGGFTLDCTHQIGEAHQSGSRWVFREDVRPFSSYNEPTKEDKRVYCVTNWVGDYFTCPTKELNLETLQNVLDDMDTMRIHGKGRRIGPTGYANEFVGAYHAIGAWVYEKDDEEWVAIDPVRFIMGLDNALQRGRWLGQKAIWDLQNNCEILVGDDEE